MGGGRPISKIHPSCTASSSRCLRATSASRAARAWWRWGEQADSRASLVGELKRLKPERSSPLPSGSSFFRSSSRLNCSSPSFAMAHVRFNFPPSSVYFFSLCFLASTQGTTRSVLHFLPLRRGEAPKTRSGSLVAGVGSFSFFLGWWAFQRKGFVFTVHVCGIKGGVFLKN